MPLGIFQVFSYIVFTVFGVVLLSRVLKWASMPMHLRWELYPVAHEPNNYGGSYMEELEWWTKKRKTTTAGMLKELLLEMLFIRRLFTHKRKLWYASFTFHGGIYLILAWFALLFTSGMATLYGGLSIPSAEPLAQTLYYLTLASGIIGVVGTTAGGLAVLEQRFGDWEMREYSSLSDYFNLVFVIVAAALGFLSWVLFDPTFEAARQFMVALLSFGQTPVLSLSALTQLQIIVVGLLFMYVPFTKMTHFVGKYFTYHAVLWEDAPNLRGSSIEQKVKENLQHRISWSAPHLHAGKTWAENATESISTTKKTEK